MSENITQQDIDEFLAQLLAEMAQETPLHDVVQNIMDEPIPPEVKERLVEPLLTRIYPPQLHLG